jgi:hypothetical protein
MPTIPLISLSLDQRYLLTGYFHLAHNDALLDKLAALFDINLEFIVLHENDVK